jgi:hypothetical protein
MTLLTLPSSEKDPFKIVAVIRQIAEFLSRNVREKLDANRTYYVRTDGNDNNSGLVNSAGGAWLTGQHAVDVIRKSLDLGGFGAIIQFAAGTYGGITVVGPWTGGGTVLLVGDITTPANIVSDAMSVSGGGQLSLAGFKIVTAQNFGLAIFEEAVLTIAGKMEYGAAVTSHLYTRDGGRIINFGNAYTISAGAAAHMFADRGSGISMAGLTATLTGTPAFSVGFAIASECGTLLANGNTYTGAATGPRYVAQANGTIQTVGGGANYFPGNAAGTTATGGQYI